MSANLSTITVVFMPLPRFQDSRIVARRFGVMAKYWTPGKVKTRLGQSIGMPQAAAIHRCFLHFLLSRHGEAANRPDNQRSLRRLAEDLDEPIHQLVAAPDRLQTTFQKQIPSGWEVVPQGSGDLGLRMRSWFQAGFPGNLDGNGQAENAPHDQKGCYAGILIGADCPLINQADVDEAWLALRSHDLVLGPALDGGYYLIGLAAEHWRPELAQLWDEIPWSTSDVFALTVKAAERMGLKVATLPPRSDVDTMEDLQALMTKLRDNCMAISPHFDRASGPNCDALTSLGTTMQMESKLLRDLEHILQPDASS